MEIGRKRVGGGGWVEAAGEGSLMGGGCGRVGSRGCGFAVVDTDGSMIEVGRGRGRGCWLEVDGSTMEVGRAFDGSVD